MYKNFSDLPEETQQKFTGPILELGVGGTFKAVYFLVYGTLRWGCGNWERYLKGVSNHVATVELPGFCKNTGIACEYTGRETDSTVFDVFEVLPEYLDRCNNAIDGLEGIGWGGYEACMVRVPLPDGTEVLAKFYQAEWGANPARSSKDYAVNRYREFNQVSKNATKELAPKVAEFYREIFNG